MYDYGSPYVGTFGQGELALYNTFSSVVLLISGLGIPSALVYFLASKKINIQKVIPMTLKVTLFSFIILILFFIVANTLNITQLFLPNFMQTQFAWNFIMLFHLILMSMNQYLQSILIAENKFNRVS